MQRLRFHSELYSAEAIDKTADLFKEHAQIECKREEPYLVVTLRGVGSEPEDRLAGEFANYLLALTAELKRAGG